VVQVDGEQRSVGRPRRWEKHNGVLPSGPRTRHCSPRGRGLDRTVKANTCPCNRANSAVDAFGCARTTRIVHGEAHRTRQTPATAVRRECHVQPAIRATASTNQRCPKATGLSSTGGVGDTEPSAECRNKSPSICRILLSRIFPPGGALMAKITSWLVILFRFRLCK
jgi:hypothetical protein